MMNASMSPPPGTASMFDLVMALIAAQVKAATLQDLVADMRGARLDSTAIQFVERRISRALDGVEIVEQTFPSGVSVALSDYAQSIRDVFAAEEPR